MSKIQKFEGDFGSRIEIRVSAHTRQPDTISIISTDGVDGNNPELTPETARELGQALIDLADQIKGNRHRPTGH